jgi:hypothetical protein
MSFIGGFLAAVVPDPLVLLACAVFAGCERDPGREEHLPPLTEKVKPENIPPGAGAA